jgi:XRE family transcriptional regulator, regulator of sulfur utilization
MKIGQSIKTLRKDVSKQKQGEFAAAISISQTYLSQIENDLREPSTEVLLRIAKHVNIPLAILFWNGVTEEDVRPEKVQYFKDLKPTIDSMIFAIFKND